MILSSHHELSDQVWKAHGMPSIMQNELRDAVFPEFKAHYKL